MVIWRVMPKADHIPVPRYRPQSGPALLDQGFRPFFLAAGSWAPLALGLFLAQITGFLTLPSAFDPVSWHVHEMLFGFVAAALAGFLLTAIPNWTGRLPLQGLPLAMLALLWCAGRLAVACSAIIGAVPAAIIDLSFLAALLAAAAREIIAGRNWRNLPLLIALMVLLAANGLSHSGIIGWSDHAQIAPRLAIAVMIMLIALIAGRITPSFTRNRLAKIGARLPRPFGRYDQATLILSLVILGGWAVMPEAPHGSVTGYALALLAALHLVRLTRWRGLAVAGDPLLFVLHAAYGWLPVGLGLLALAEWWPELAPTSALHALTAGAMGTMILAVMSRATLGHTGRALRASAALTLSFVAITLAVIARLSANWWNDPMTALTVAALLWIMAFVLFLGVCGPMLMTPKPGGGKSAPQPG